MVREYCRSEKRRWRNVRCSGFSARIESAPAPALNESREEGIAEEAARRWVAGCSEQEHGWVPRRELESWLGLVLRRGVRARASASSLRQYLRNRPQCLK